MILCCLVWNDILKRLVDQGFVMHSDGICLVEGLVRNVGPCYVRGEDISNRGSWASMRSEFAIRAVQRKSFLSF